MRREALLLLLEQQPRAVELSAPAVLLEQEEEARIGGIFRFEGPFELIALCRHPASCLDDHVSYIPIHQRRWVWTHNHCRWRRPLSRWGSLPLRV